MQTLPKISAGTYNPCEYKAHPGPNNTAQALLACGLKHSPLPNGQAGTVQELVQQWLAGSMPAFLPCAGIRPPYGQRVMGGAVFIPLLLAGILP
jgi:hypothetical protein